MEEIASSVERFGRYANCSGSSVLGQVCWHTNLSALAFPGNRTHDLGAANAMLYHLSYRKAPFSAATLQILFMLKQQHYTLTNVKKVNSFE